MHNTRRSDNSVYRDSRPLIEIKSFGSHAKGFEKVYWRKMAAAIMSIAQHRVHRESHRAQPGSLSALTISNAPVDTLRYSSQASHEHTTYPSILSNKIPRIPSSTNSTHFTLLGNPPDEASAASFSKIFVDRRSECLDVGLNERRSEVSRGHRTA